MIRFLLEIHKYFYGKNNRNHYKQHNKIKWLICNVISIICGMMFYYYMKIRRIICRVPVPKGKINNEVVVSFTSYPARIGTLWMVVDSLFRQKITPSKIILYLSKVNFPKKEKDLPNSLLSYCGDFFSIVWVDDNLMPHKKYFYAFQQYRDKIIITVDDDNYYRDDLIKTLWDIHLNFPNCVCANTVSEIVNENGIIDKYENWNSNIRQSNNSSFNYLAIGASGILYPMGEYRKSASSNPKTIIRTCLRADDLWLKCHELLFDIPVAHGDYYCPAMPLFRSQRTSLVSFNDSSQSHGNDVQWSSLDLEYGLNEKLQKLVNCERAMS